MPSEADFSALSIGTLSVAAEPMLAISCTSEAQAVDTSIEAAGNAWLSESALHLGEDALDITRRQRGKHSDRLQG